MTLPRIAVTMGDPAGIGPEICLRLLAQPTIHELCVPIVLGDAQLMRRVAKSLGLEMPFCVFSHEDWAMSSEDYPAAVCDLSAIDATSVQPGIVDENTGKASYCYIQQSIAAALSGRVDAVTTGPIHKAALSAAGVPYPGHTEIFAAQSGSARVCMMLTCPEITCSFVTAHAAYRDVPKLLSVDRILEVIELSHEAIWQIHDKRAKLTVCGLNPHAGENGLFGDREEERLIAPAVRAAQSLGINVDGPIPPDTAFLPARRRETDCFVCMYHDQGLIPLKALAFDVAVNITLGLPIIRTSVDHGTACDVAWQGKADHTSLCQAVKLAARLAKKSCGQRAALG